jgi:flagellar hook-basal body complex protein FliE
MAGLNPIAGMHGVHWPSNVTDTGAAGGAAPAGAKEGAPPQAAQGFTDALRQAVSTVDRDQQASASAIQDLLAGKSENPLPVVMAVAKADLSFKLLVGVRNKMIEAYKQTINMQV